MWPTMSGFCVNKKSFHLISISPNDHLSIFVYRLGEVSVCIFFFTLTWVKGVTNKHNLELRINRHIDV